LKILLLAMLVVALGIACSGGDDGNPAAQASLTTSTTATEPEQDAGDFLKEITERGLRGQYGRNWETLHPAHQAIVSRAKYDSCERQNDQGTGATKIDITVEDTYTEPVLVKGLGTVPSTAVTLRFSYDNPLTGKPAEEHATGHAVAVDGQWRWILKPQDYDAFVKGKCPPAS
jgi:hypothetical protein